MIKIFLIFNFFISFTYANNLQDAINNAPSGSIIKLSNGVYEGAIIINKPLTILGVDNDVVIKGDNNSSVITINSSNVTIKNLIVKESGNNPQTLHSAISLNNVKNIHISNSKLINSLYGIDMNIVQDSVIADNYISSVDTTIPFRGNAIKMYYSNNNRIINNHINKVRDVTLNYSNNNIIKNNTFTYNRFGLHLSLSHNNIISNNTFKYNSVAVMIMGAKNTKVIKNKILSSNGATGIGILLKNVHNCLLKENIISYNTQAIYIDAKVLETGMQRYILDNTISYNKEAFHFHAIIQNNTIKNNKIYGNIDDVVKDTKGNTENSNLIAYNYWDCYTGFDKNNDNIGDTSHKIFIYADQLWNFNHKIKFFYASPVISLMNFLSKLAPFTEPVLLLEDTSPLVSLPRN